MAWEDSCAAPNFAALTTLFADGSPQSHVVWIDHADGLVLINTEIHRQKYLNLSRDGRCAIAVIEQDPYTFTEIRGRLVDEVRGPEARRHIDQLSMKYRGRPYSDALVETERVVLRVSPTVVVRHAGPRRIREL